MQDPMTRLELNEHENKVLTEMIESAISDLGYEIANTDSADYRDGLKDKKTVAAAILQRLQDTSG
jgi:hypothetical protein